MKAIKPPKAPSPKRGPLPSHFARTFYQPLRSKSGRGKFVLAAAPGSRLQDFYGTTYVVQMSGALEKIL